MPGPGSLLRGGSVFAVLVFACLSCLPGLPARASQARGVITVSRNLHAASRVWSATSILPAACREVPLTSSAISALQTHIESARAVIGTAGATSGIGAKPANAQVPRSVFNRMTEADAALTSLFSSLPPELTRLRAAEAGLAEGGELTIVGERDQHAPVGLVFEIAGQDGVTLELELDRYYDAFSAGDDVGKFTVTVGDLQEGGKSRITGVVPFPVEAIEGLSQMAAAHGFDALEIVLPAPLTVRDPGSPGGPAER